MALPTSLHSSLMPSEVEFVATEELIGIRPSVRMDKIRFISGVYGPFIGGRTVQVPLWMAVNLKLKKKCNIVPPEWLNVGGLITLEEFLQEKLGEETSQQSFSTLPFRFAETAKVLLDVASDDLEQPEKIRFLLKDLREAREAKCRDGLRIIDTNALLLWNLCSMEINEIRPFFIRAMSVLTQLSTEGSTRSM